MADFATQAELEVFMGLATGALATRGPAVLGYASSAIRMFTRQDIEVTTGRQESFAGDPWRDYIVLTQRPVTAVTAITVNSVAYTDFTWSRWGNVFKNTAPTAWDTGPILVVYDSGYGATSDEYLGVKTICLEAASRAIGGSARYVRVRRGGEPRVRPGDLPHRRGEDVSRAIHTDNGRLGG